MTDNPAVRRLRVLPTGTRVVVRYRLETGGATDALGELLAVGPDSCTVRTRRGETSIAFADVLLAKPVPPPPARRSPPPG